MKKAAIYLRVSGVGQTKEDKYGLADQLSKVNEYLKDCISCVFMEQITGSALLKPELENAFEFAKREKCAIYMCGDDRFSRDLIVKLLTKERFRKEGVEYVDVLMPITEKTPEADFFSNIMGCVSQLDKGKIVRRLFGGRVQKAPIGYAGGSPPYGYSVDKEGNLYKDDNYKYVEMIVELYNNTKRYSMVAKVLNEQGARTRHGKEFKAETVKRILNSPSRDGKVKYAGIYAKI